MQFIMAQYEHLPIYKAAFDLLVYLEKTVAGFSRYHKYTHGAALRDGAREALLLVIRANSASDKRPVLEDLRLKIEELKTLIRLCKELKAFPNFKAFETSINKLTVIARQNEGWLKSQATRKWSESPVCAPRDGGR